MKKRSAIYCCIVIFLGLWTNNIQGISIQCCLPQNLLSAGATLPMFHEPYGRNITIGASTRLTTPVEEVTTLATGLISSWLHSRKEFANFASISLHSNWHCYAIMVAPPHPPASTPWKPPWPGSMKLNFDRNAWGCLGSLVTGVHSETQMETPLSPMLGQWESPTPPRLNTLLFSRGLPLFWDHLSNPLIIEGDSQVVIC